MTSRQAIDGRANADFVRGVDEGARLALGSVPLPPLQGGPYAVGLLHGYSRTRRAHGGRSQHKPTAT